MTTRAMMQAHRNCRDPKHRNMDPHTGMTVSLAESLWEWIEEQGGTRSAVVEMCIRKAMECQQNTTTK